MPDKPALPAQAPARTGAPTGPAASPTARPGPPKTGWPARWAKAFGAFWWDFLVGETPELFIGVLVALGVLALLVKASSLNAVAVGIFPVLVVSLLGVSAYRARRAKD